MLFGEHKCAHPRPDIYCERIDGMVKSYTIYNCINRIKIMLKSDRKISWRYCRPHANFNQSTDASICFALYKTRNDKTWLIGVENERLQSVRSRKLFQYFQKSWRTSSTTGKQMVRQWSNFNAANLQINGIFGFWNSESELPHASV